MRLTSTTKYMHYAPYYLLVKVRSATVTAW